jgi:hypothetical protein
MKLLLLAIAVTALVLGGTIVHQARLPRWKRLFFYIEDSVDAGRGISEIEAGLVTHYGLDILTARLCLEHRGDVEWFRNRDFS